MHQNTIRSGASVLPKTAILSLAAQSRKRDWKKVEES